MASIYDDIRAALEVKLSTVTNVPSIGWENAQFSPTTGQPYLKPRLIPTRREPAVRGTNPQMLYQGIFRVVCYVPEGAGPSAGDDLADKIIDAFEATTDVGQGSTIVSIRYAEREMAEIDGPFYMIPVNIGWYIYK
ncbi:DUF4128 domain-containing protein [bacterium]|jgi:hypothetical protein|nr:DUF4128 domain-containing protein [bacterium]MDB4296095.1 DUF4128 domain-containing protein [bacterium]MDB4352548.1 DUF4128 domain-containing protein [Porticoccaceae bacterium]